MRFGYITHGLHSNQRTLKSYAIGLICKCSSYCIINNDNNRNLLYLSFNFAKVYIYNCFLKFALVRCVLILFAPLIKRYYSTMAFGQKLKQDKHLIQIVTKE